MFPPCDENDDDSDGLSECEGDCDDTNLDVYLGAPELCDGIDNQCPGDVGYGQTDEDFPDSDGDTIADCVDNCDDDANMAQEDADHDGSGDACDNCPATPNAGQEDADSDGLGDVRYNCPFNANRDQADFDEDLEADRCDLDDGLILVYYSDIDFVNWQEEAGFDLWNCYRGDLDVLRSDGYYTQSPSSNDLAARFCDLTSTLVPDSVALASGAAAHYLVTGEIAGVESSLGLDSDGLERPNDYPCP